MKNDKKIFERQQLQDTRRSKNTQTSRTNILGKI